MNELRNIDVHIISLVDKGANKKKIIWKTDDNGKPMFDRTVPIIKTDDEKKIAYGIVYSPNEEDAHGDYSTEKSIEEACYNFMKNKRTNEVDKQHDLDTQNDQYVGESWIVKENDALFPKEVGGWAVGIKVEDEEIWKSIKSGEITGISMYGYAEKVEKSDDDKIEKGILKYFRKIFLGETEVEDNEKLIKDFNDKIAMLDYPKLIDALYSAAYDIIYNENIDDKNSALLESIDQFKSYLGNVETAKSLVQKEGKTISSANMKKLQSASDALKEVLDSAGKASEKKQLHKSEIEKNKPEGEIEMTPEEIKKQIDEALKPVTEANETLKTENADLKKRLEDVEKLSKGSTQGDDPADPEKAEVKKIFSWASGIASATN
jgi:hypothetical protein